ncbi:MAG: radical SAM protein [Crenarchaeota archaeon]|nr:radical SAM protein [Thermoproteota archaeon]
MAAEPTTVYLLQYSPAGCGASCGFCAQSRKARGSRGEWLSRVRWPARPLGELLEALRRGRGRVARVCYQTILKPGFVEEMLRHVEALAATGIPLSVATTPLPRPVLERLHGLGVERLGVGLDAATPALARRVGKPYPWSAYMRFVEEGVRVFGRGMVHVHLVAGLGETPREMVEAMRRVYAVGARVALFRYTPLPGLPRYPGVSLPVYRALQLALLLLEEGLNPLDYIDFTQSPPKALKKPPLPGDRVLEAMLTSGCPGCNRPFYNETPRGPIYNYPSRRMLLERREQLARELEALGAGGWLA